MAAIHGDDDDILLARAATGDGDAFARFYRRHLTAIAGYLLRRTGDAEVTADLTAEVFAAALLACPRYRPGGPPALAWLYGIAANKLRESRRRGRVEQEARRRLAWEPQALDDADLAAVEQMAGNDDESELLAAVATLPPEQRDAIVARVVEEQGYDEIASRLLCSESVVRQRVSRGLRALRAQLREAP
ncbi:MAG TPA: RNA polymerase sigma factor [Conexibacter sp.]|jgi:RNA polymerase sigma factor (sigma-70 family)|nr:RNA polymerase sigma factor [Conexibacter sp.]